VSSTQIYDQLYTYVSPGVQKTSYRERHSDNSASGKCYELHVLNCVSLCRVGYSVSAVLANCNWNASSPNTIRIYISGCQQRWLRNYRLLRCDPGHSGRYVMISQEETPLKSRAKTSTDCVASLLEWRGVRWVGQVVRMMEMRISHTIFVGKSEGRGLLGGQRLIYKVLN
jgi:hypothetical protein